LERALPTLPKEPRLFVDDVTPEALAEVLNKTPGEALAIIEDEAGLFEVISGLYSGGKANLNLFLRAWDGGPVQVDRKGRDPVRLNKPLLTFALSVQPEVLTDIAQTRGFRGKGLLARFLYCMPTSKVGYRNTKTDPIPADIAQQWEKLVWRLLDTPPAAVDAWERPKPHLLTVDPAAVEMWLDFADDVEKELRPGGGLEFLRDWGGKLPGAAVRLAGLYHGIETDPPQDAPVAPSTMLKALQTASVLAEHAKAAFLAMGSDPAFECARRIWRWIEDTQTTLFSGRDALRAVRGSFPRMEQVKDGLEVLEERNFIRIEAIESGGAGRPPSPKYAVNPKIEGKNKT